MYKVKGGPFAATSGVVALGWDSHRITYVGRSKRSIRPLDPLVIREGVAVVGAFINSSLRFNFLLTSAAYL